MNLISILPEERRPALRQWQLRLQTTVERTFADQLDKLEASDEDRQGLGIGHKEGESALKFS